MKFKCYKGEQRQGKTEKEREREGESEQARKQYEWSVGWAIHFKNA